MRFERQRLNRKWGPYYGCTTGMLWATMGWTRSLWLFFRVDCFLEFFREAMGNQQSSYNVHKVSTLHSCHLDFCWASQPSVSVENKKAISMNSIIQWQQINGTYIVCSSFCRTSFINAPTTEHLESSPLYLCFFLCVESSLSTKPRARDKKRKGAWLAWDYHILNFNAI